MAAQVAGQDLDQDLAVKEYQERLNHENHRKLFMEILEYEYGLKDELVTWNILSKPQLEEIKSLKNRCKVIAKLIEMLCEENELKPYKNFMRSLCETHQEHFKRYIHNNGYTNDGLRPLKDQERGQLQRLRSFLITQVRPSLASISNYMYRHKFISKNHFDDVNEEGIKIKERVDMLLEIVESRCFDHYIGFLACLEIENPTTFRSSAIKDCPACVALKSYVKPVSSESSGIELEKTLLEIYKSMTYEEFQDKVKEILKMAFPNYSEEEFEDMCTVLGMASGSIRIFLSCGSLKALHVVPTIVRNGRMKLFLELLFNHLLGGKAVIVAHVFVLDYCYQDFSLRCALASVNASDRHSKHELLRNGGMNMKKTFDMDPFKKAKERILICAYLWREASDREVSSHPKQEAFVHLSSVCREWWTTFQQRATFKASLQRRLKQPDGRIKLTNRSSILFEDRVVCATQLNDAIYVVVSNETNTLRQYSAKYRQLIEKSVVAENIRISSIEASESDGIFCVDETDGAVWLWTKGQQPPHAVIKQFSPCRCIAVSAEDQMRILLLAGNNFLEMHDQHSKIIQTVQLPRGIDNPLWIVRNRDGFILVSHGSNTGERHRICLVNRHGSVVLTYGGKRGHGPGELNRPCCMTLDEEDRVFIADASNHRVVVLDSKMKMINVVLDEKYDEINSPSSLHYVRDSKQLLVTRGNYLDIYDVEVNDGTVQSKKPSVGVKDVGVPSMTQESKEEKTPSKLRKIID